MENNSKKQPTSIHLLDREMAELIAAGIEAVQAEAQAQLDAYLAGN